MIKNGEWLLRKLARTSLVIAVIAICLASVRAEEATVLKASDGQQGDAFGSAVAISGDYAAVGNYPEIAHGKVYVFKKGEDETWTQTKILEAESPQKWDEFGFALEITEDYIIVGSPGHNDDEGAAFIYKRDGENWTLAQTLTPALGSAVSGFGEVISLAGNYLLIAAPYGSISSNDNGKAFLYKLTDGTWSPIKAFAAPDGIPSDAGYAYTVAITSNFAIITAPEAGTEGKGEAYIYSNDSDTWTLTATFGTPEGYSSLGESVAISDSFACATCLYGDDMMNGGVIVWANNAGTWSQSQFIQAPSSTENMFGYAMRINDKLLAISDPMLNFSGAIYTYVLDSGKWTFEKSYTVTGTHFPSLGFSIDLDSDEHLLAGYPYANVEAGDAYLWKLSTSYITLLVDPVDSGGTTPSENTQHIVSTGKAFDVTASAASGYGFVSWDPSENVTVLDPKSATTKATVTGVAELTAKFVKLALVTFNVSPSGAGSTSPDGAFSVGEGNHIQIAATPADGYYFSEWIVSGAAIIDDPLDKRTQVLVNGDCFITAKFLPFTKEVQLTMNRSPETGGDIVPSAGTHLVESGRLFSVTAVPVTGMHFVKWTITGTGVISNPLASVTNASISENSTITAFFAENTSTATLTMAIDPVASGSTNPATGSSTVNVGQPVKIEASSATGYHFTSWTISGLGTIDGTANVTAWVTLAGDATVTANFAANTETAELTVTVSPSTGGHCNPGVGTHKINIGETFEISATAADGYYFVNWVATRGVAVGDSKINKTVAILSGNADLEAVFAETSKTATLTFSHSPEEGGGTNPGTGEHTVTVGESLKIEAIPSKGYYFTHWGLTGTSLISDPDNAETIITIYGDSSVVANFAVSSSSATLTMALSPEKSGTTNPGLGTHSVVVGKNYKITAYPGDNYVFNQWTVSGGATVSDPEIQETWLVLSADATVTALFISKQADVQLIMAASPDAAGSTDPGLGVHTVSMGAKFEVEAVPAAGYFFSFWGSDGNIDVEDRYSEKTLVKIKDDATLTAHFFAASTSAVLSLGVSPEKSGNTNPGIGAHTVNVDEKIEVEAIPENGYHFVEWELSSGDALIARKFAKKTYVVLQKDSTIIAKFEANATPVTVEMKVSPENAGSTSPGEGEHTGFFAGQIIEIQALAADGYHFVKWTDERGANISNPLAPETSAQIVGDTIITANFAANASSLTLVMINSDPHAGLIYPIPGAHAYNVGQSIKLEAASFDNYHFVKWELTGDGYIDDDKSQIAYAVLKSDSTIKAVFSAEKPVFLTYGSVLAVDISDYEIPPTKFYATYYNKKNPESNPKLRQFKSLLIDDQAKTITGEWRRSLRLYNPKDYPKGEQLSELLLVNPVEDLKLYEVYLQVNAETPENVDLNAYIASPMLDSVSGEHEEKGDVFTVAGRFFGQNVPTIQIEYLRGESFKYKRCEIRKVESLIYQNARGVDGKSCMKILSDDPTDNKPVGYSRVTVVYPKLHKNAVPTGYLIIKNKFGMDAIELPEKE